MRFPVSEVAAHHVRHGASGHRQPGGRFDRGHEILGNALTHLRPQGFLVLEVVVDQAWGHPSLLRDQAHRRPIEARPRKERQRRFQNDVARIRRRVLRAQLCHALFSCLI
ncbi:hypothetical protein G6F57_021663 [Rhizopus arrhizus]|nr:hypothetical protein G6F57_021663 [Rhizopus arrhizus]